jgi:hypothetical protein
MKVDGQQRSCSVDPAKCHLGFRVLVMVLGIESFLSSINIG